MLNIQHLKRDVLDQHWKVLHMIVSQHQFSKTQATKNSRGGGGGGTQRNKLNK